jgi:uncharacterized protein YfaS (alpha-2-macroglobulin family)
MPRELFVRFSDPVVSLDQSANSESSSQPGGAATLPRVEITPALPGRAYFQTPERLVYDTDQEPQPATRYSVALYPPTQPREPARWSQLGAGPGGLALRWEFETDRPRVEGFMPEGSDEPRPRTAQVVIQFSQRIAAARIASYVRAQVIVAGKPGPAVPVRVSAASFKDLRQANLYTTSHEGEEPHWIKVQPQTLWPVGATIRLSVLPGWSGEEGPLPADTPWETEFHTLPALRLLTASCTAAKPCAQDPVVLRFNNEIAYDETKKIVVTPKPEWLTTTTGNTWYRRSSAHNSSAEDETGHTIEVEGAFLPGRRYRIRVPGEVRDVYGQKLGTPLEVTAVFAPRSFLALSNERGILRTSGPQTIGVTTRHLQAVEVRAQVIDDEQALDLLIANPQKRPAARDNDADDDEPTLPAPRPQFVQQLTLKPHGPTDWASVAIDLASLTRGARGAVLLEVVPMALAPGRAGLALPAQVRGLYRLTDLGPILTASRPRSMLSVHRLSDGAAVAAAQISRITGPGQKSILGRTDAHGVLSLKTPDDSDWSHARALFVVEAETATGGGQPGTADRTYLSTLPGGRERDDNHDGKQPALRRGERLMAQVVTERDAYRPGETVRCVGFSAIESPYVASSLRRTPEGAAVELTLRDGQQRTVARRSVKTTGEGKFFAELPLPASAALGAYHLEAELFGSSHSARVKVEDYRTPEYAVTAAPEREEVLFPARPTIRVAATYFFGGDVALVRGTARQHCAPTQYRPPQLPSDFRTGAPILDSSRDSEIFPILSQAGGKETRGRVSFTPPETGPHNDPRRCTVSVSVADTSQQNIGAETNYLVHPAPYYLALQPPNSSLYVGDTLTFAVRAVAPDGTRVAAAGVVAKIERHYHETLFRTVGKERVFDRIVERSEPAPGCTLTLTAAGTDATCRVTDLREGRYLLRLTGGPGAEAARQETNVYVQKRLRDQPKLPMPPPPPPHLSLWLAQAQGQPGDVLDAQVSAPWPFSGTVIIARKGVREHIPFSITAAGGGAVPLKLAIDDSWVPTVHLRVVGVRPPPEDGSRPQVETVQRSVHVAHAHRRLQVQVEAPRETGPGSKVPIVVRVRDSANQPVAAAAQSRVALWAVDEAVLSLTNYQVPEILPSFIPQGEILVSQRDEYTAILSPYVPDLDDPWLMPHLSGMTGFGHGGGAGVGHSYGAGGLGVVPPARQRFETTPVFLGDIAVGPDGVARIEAQLPDNLTTFRITAIASARLVDEQSPGRFGMGDTQLRVSQPFLVRAALPRLLRPSDRATLGAILTNRSAPAGHAEVQILLHQDPNKPVITLQSPASLQQPLATFEVLRVPFLVAAERPGTAELELVATLRPIE